MERECVNQCNRPARARGDDCRQCYRAAYYRRKRREARERRKEENWSEWQWNEYLNLDSPAVIIKLEDMAFRDWQNAQD